MIRMNSQKTVLMPKSLEDNQVQLDNICKAFNNGSASDAAASIGQLFRCRGMSQVSMASGIGRAVLYRSLQSDASGAARLVACSRSHARCGGSQRQVKKTRSKQLGAVGTKASGGSFPMRVSFLACPLEGFCRVKTAREGGRGQGALTRDAKVLSNRGYMSIFPPEGPILSIR